MPPEKNWAHAERISLPQAFQAAIGGHTLVSKALYARGYRTVEAAQAFLNADAYRPTPAGELPDIQPAADLLMQALEKSQRILVWGDFDVDGQTATTLLVEGLRQLGGRVAYHIPVRAEESHGITRQVLDVFLQQGFDLFLTCDTGITENDNIQHIRRAGKPVIITDHHSLPKTFPPANAIINPQCLPGNHPLRTLPGVGVAYKLVEFLFNECKRPFDADRFMELAALGIVADVAELQSDTRYLLQKGLVSLRRTNRIGLELLYRHAELNSAHLDEDHIGFQVAPRLNAVGRLGDANPMVEFLTTENHGRARILANQVEAMNARRRFTTRQVDKAAEALLQASPEDRHAPAIVLHFPNWPAGVVGIVANRLVERYQKPVLLLTGEDPIRGSGRSLNGIHITEAIAAQESLLLGYGGHPMAAGLSLRAANFKAFKRGFWAAVEQQARHISAAPAITVNQVLTLPEINLELVEQVRRLAPFGPGNPPLHFLIRNLTLISAAKVGQHGEHRQMTAADENDCQQRFIWWNGGDELLPQAPFDLVCSLGKSDYKGNPQVSAEWIDYRLSEEGRQQLARQQYEIIDHRSAAPPLQILRQSLLNAPHAIVWAEGALPPDIPCLTRYALGAAKTLIIWTAPPSQSLLQEALHRVRPETLILFGQEPGLESSKALMNRLAGLAKYALQHKQAEAQLEPMAAACAAEVETVRIGLQLWAARGKLSLVFAGETVQVSPGKNIPDPDAIAVFETILRDLLDESRAYRQYYKQCNLKSILPGANPNP